MLPLLLLAAPARTVALETSSGSPHGLGKTLATAGTVTAWR